MAQVTSQCGDVALVNDTYTEHFKHYDVFIMHGEVNEKNQSVSPTVNHNYNFPKRPPSTPLAWGHPRVNSRSITKYLISILIIYLRDGLELPTKC